MPAPSPRAGSPRPSGARACTRSWPARTAQPVGYVVTSDNPFGLNPGDEVTVEQLWVAPDARRGGVAKALLTAVLDLAERSGCEVVTSNVPTPSREANRFFARLGFGSVVTRRVVSHGRPAAPDCAGDRRDR